MMSNRLLFSMTALVIIGMGILLALNLNSIFNSSTIQKTYLNLNDVRGVAVKHNQLLYTLNFSQQNTLIDSLNQSKSINAIPSDNRQKKDIEEIIIYRFGKNPTLVLTPLTYVNDNLVYSAPDWNPDGYLIDTSNGHLKKLLSTTYDP